MADTNENNNEEKLEDKIRDTLSRGAEASKKAFQKAGSAVQRFSDKSVLKIEKKQLEGSVNKKQEEMGKLLSDLLLVKGVKLEKLSELIQSNETVKNAVDAIEKLHKEIASLKDQIKAKDEAINAI